MHHRLIKAADVFIYETPDEIQRRRINIYLRSADLVCPCAALVRAPPGTVKTQRRAALTEALIKTMKLVIILDFQSSAVVVMRPHRSRRIKDECNK